MFVCLLYHMTFQRKSSSILIVKNFLVTVIAVFLDYQNQVHMDSQDAQELCIYFERLDFSLNFSCLF